MDEMRDFLDSILDFINSESLTDEEYATIELEEADYTKEVYLALKTILESRENVSGQTKRLKLLFLAKGVDLSETASVPKPQTNIFIGSPL